MLATHTSPQSLTAATHRAIPLSYQLLFWLAYTLFWHLVFSPSFWSVGGFVTSCIYTLVHAGASYTNILVLIPRLWQTNKLLYVLSVLLLLVCSSGLLAGVLYVWFSWANPQTLTIFFTDFNIAVGSFFGSTFSGVMLTMGMYLLLHKRKLEQRQQQLEQEKLKAELQFLRQQIDPHFLFNVLNNIYFLIKKDPDAAAESLAGFSELLRYQIYQAQTDTIPLIEEFDYLRKYANLASLRLPKDATIELDLPVADSSLLIPPLLLLPLVENAFKHVDKDNCNIHIIGRLIGGELAISVSNSKAPIAESTTSNMPKPAGGIGLVNLEQRLALLYPNQHELKVNAGTADYSTYLKIQLA